MKLFSALGFLAVLSAASANAAVLIHTNDLLGELEPCGCRSNPMGGVAREANLIKRQEDQSQLKLDGGDLLFQTDHLPDVLKPQAEVQASYLIKALNLLKQDAVVPGEKDFALGVKVFNRLRKAAKFRFLASNLALKKGGPFLESHAIFRLKTAAGKPLRVGVIGVVGQDLNWPKELKVSPPISSVKAQVKALRGQVDRLVVLSHLGFDGDKELAKAVRGIDFIVGGHTQSFLQTPSQIEKTWIFQSSFRNQYVGIIPLDGAFDPDSYKLIGLDAGYDSPTPSPSDAPAAAPATARTEDQLVVEFKKAIADFNTQLDADRDAVVASTSTASKARFQTFPRCSECHLKQFDFWRKTAHAGALHPLMSKQDFKNKECLSCHTVGLGEPDGFSSVNRLAEFRKSVPEAAPDPSNAAPISTPSESETESKEQTQFMDAESLDKFLESMRDASSIDDKIRVTSADPEKRPVRQALNSLVHSWTPVQCENCHGPGVDHPFSGNYTKKVESTVCLSCHTNARAPEWYGKDGKPDLKLIDQKRTLIQCPAGDPN